MIKTINIIGAGNVATHLVKHFLNQKDICIKTVFSRQLKHAEVLVENTNTLSINSINNIDTTADLTIVCVKDDAIKEVVLGLPKSMPLVHTSGSVSVKVLSKFKKSGILYPLQTFSKAKPLNMSSIPFLIESNNKEFEDELTQFCMTNLSTFVQVANSELRSEIHLAAVISNNFITSLLFESSKILEQNSLNLSLLKPLIEETISKSFETTPKDAQTGPAVRRDVSILKTQVDKITNPILKDIYKLMTNLIQEQNN